MLLSSAEVIQQGIRPSQRYLVGEFVSTTNLLETRSFDHAETTENFWKV